MNKKLEEALQSVEMTYAELVQMANDMTKPLFGSIDEIVQAITATVNSLSIDQLRNYILSLQLKAFEISEIKEKAAVKAEIAETLQKESYAISFNALEGSADRKSTRLNSSHQV